jgi:hypothetical protein
VTSARSTADRTTQPRSGAGASVDEVDAVVVGAGFAGLYVMPYVGGVGAYRKKCDEVAATGYEGFALTA